MQKVLILLKKKLTRARGRQQRKEVELIWWDTQKMLTCKNKKCMQRSKQRNETKKKKKLKRLYNTRFLNSNAEIDNLWQRKDTKKEIKAHARIKLRYLKKAIQATRLTELRDAKRYQPLPGIEEL